jgi:hypothetical protein
MTKLCQNGRSFLAGGQRAMDEIWAFKCKRQGEHGHIGSWLLHGRLGAKRA